MLNKSINIESDDPIWSVPEAVTDRLNSRTKNTEYTAFIFCGAYCAVAIIFLLIFGMAAIGRGETSFAIVIFGFAIATGFFLWGYLGK